MARPSVTHIIWAWGGTSLCHPHFAGLWWHVPVTHIIWAQGALSVWPLLSMAEVAHPHMPHTIPGVGGTSLCPTLPGTGLLHPVTVTILAWGDVSLRNPPPPLRSAGPRVSLARLPRMSLAVASHQIPGDVSRERGWAPAMASCQLWPHASSWQPAAGAITNIRGPPHCGDLPPW